MREESDSEVDALSGMWASCSGESRSFRRRSHFGNARGVLTAKVSLRKKYVTSQAIKANVADIPQGKKYGYSRRNLERPKRRGKRSAGCDREPPIIGANVQPVDQEMGTQAYAYAAFNDGALYRGIRIRPHLRNI